MASISLFINVILLQNKMVKSRLSNFQFPATAFVLCQFIKENTLSFQYSYEMNEWHRLQSNSWKNTKHLNIVFYWKQAEIIISFGCEFFFKLLALMGSRDRPTFGIDTTDERKKMMWWVTTEIKARALIDLRQLQLQQRILMLSSVCYDQNRNLYGTALRFIASKLLFWVIWCAFKCLVLSRNFR